MYSAIDIPVLTRMGFPIQKSPGQSLFNSSPKLIAVSHVFHRHPTPRHPPSALPNLAIKIFHLRHWATFPQAPLKLHYSIFSFQRTILGLPPMSSKLKAQSQIYSLNKFFSFELSTLSNILVEVNGIEPMTSCVQGRCSPNWATPPV